MYLHTLLVLSGQPELKPSCWRAYLTVFFFNLVCLVLSRSVLYQRGVYHPDGFIREAKYGITTLVTNDDGLKNYLENVIKQLKGTLGGGDPIVRRRGGGALSFCRDAGACVYVYRIMLLCVVVDGAGQPRCDMTVGQQLPSTLNFST